jgi:hypothetical protein
MSARVVELRPQPEPIQVAEYQPAAIHEGVPVGALVAALACRGLTLSNVPGHGIVIHLIGQDPCLPARSP